MAFRRIAAALLACGCVAAAVPASAATLQVVSGQTNPRAVTISSFDPLGQSFTAIDTDLTSFGFQFSSLNPDRVNDPISFSLLAGEGLSGASLFTTAFTLPTSINSRTPTWYDFDITGANVTVGQKYTAVLSTSASARNAVVLGPGYNSSTGQFSGGDAYAGGRAFFSAPSYANCDATPSNCDLNFRVTGNTAVVAPVPEPASWAMMMLGIGLAGGTLRRRRRFTTVAA